MQLLFASLTAFVIAIHGYRRQSLSLSGAIAAFCVGCVTLGSANAFASTLLFFYFSSSRLTRYKSELKKKQEDHYKPGGQRDAFQVACNGLLGTLFALQYIHLGLNENVPLADLQKVCIWYPQFKSLRWYVIALIAQYACCCGDTWASEIGSVWPAKNPFHVVLWKRVPRGVNGAISLAGTLASFAGGLCTAAAFLVPVWWSGCFRVPFVRILLFGFLSGGLGSFLDSVMGALFQASWYSTTSKRIVQLPAGTVAVWRQGAWRIPAHPDWQHVSGRDWLSNEMVNLLSSALTAVFVAMLDEATL